MYRLTLFESPEVLLGATADLNPPHYCVSRCCCRVRFIICSCAAWCAVMSATAPRVVLVGGSAADGDFGETAIAAAAAVLSERVPFQKIGSAWSSYQSEAAADAPRRTGGAPMSQPVHSGRRDDLWFATEKIHGAQLQLYITTTCAKEDDRDTPAVLVVRAAKRSGWIDPFDSFFGVQEVIHTEAAALLLALQRSNGVDCARGGFMVLYGELFGGWYPDAANWRGALKSGRVTDDGRLAPGHRPAVQEGVYYAHGVHFAVFDIATVPVAGAASVFLSFESVVTLCTESGLLHVPVLARGSEADVQRVGVDFDSLVPAAVEKRQRRSNAVDGAWVPLPNGTNLAEGIVIRPNSGQETVLQKGGAPARPMFKRKNRAFAEVEAIERPRDDEQPHVLVERVWRACLNRNRVDAALSKLGRDTKLETTAEAIVEDIETDFWEVAPPIYQTAFSAADGDLLAAARDRLYRAALQEARLAATSRL